MHDLCTLFERFMTSILGDNPYFCSVDLKPTDKAKEILIS